MFDLEGCHDILDETNDDVLYQLPSSSLVPHVNYSCGSCGYELNLNSSNRDAATIGCQYARSIKRGSISFFSIDESRFIQINRRRCKPYYTSKQSWGLFRRQTRLLCGKCRKFIGIIHNESSNSPFSSFRSYDSSVTWDGISGHRTYDIKITSLQPSQLFEKPAAFI